MRAQSIEICSVYHYLGIVSGVVENKASGSGAAGLA